jgi:hypothetical protein
MECEERYNDENGKAQNYNNENYRFSLASSILASNDNIE